jgi:hypothetical protein
MLVSEEAHRYVPASPGVGFAAASRAITRLARAATDADLTVVYTRPSATNVSYPVAGTPVRRRR